MRGPVDKYSISCYIILLVLAAATATSLYYLTNNSLIQHYSNDDSTISKRRKLEASFHEVNIKQPLLQDRKDYRDIQFAAFGASDTWGSGIIGDRNILTYPKLLSPEAANLAIRATGPGYPAACTQTMIQDKQFDVIILEFLTDGTEGLATLTRRLRERFPDAIIIILREWNPLWIQNQDGVNTKLWALKNGFREQPSVHDPRMHEAFRSSNDVWSFPNVETRIRNQENIANMYGAHILEMEKPNDAKNWVDYHSLISKDYFHKSNEGHAEVANRIRKLVEEIGVPKQSRQGKWESMDSCNSWFDTGHVTGIKISPSWRLSQFSVMKKYALELQSNHGTITVHNPSQKPMNVYIAYMITSPAPNSYPKVTVSILNSELTLSEPIPFKLEGPSYYGNNFVHIHIMEKVGTIPPGNAVLKFKPLEKKVYPFRIVSVAVTNEEISFGRGQPAGITTWVCQDRCGCFKEGTASVANLYRCA